MKLGTPPRFYNKIVRHIVGTAGSVTDNARLFMLINVGMADAGILAWYYKYHYDFWRPVAGIREAPSHAVPGWKPIGGPRTNEIDLGDGEKLSVTPNFPSYPSGHATFGSACFNICRAFFGGSDNLPAPITVVSRELNGTSVDSSGALRPFAPMTFSTFSKMIEDNARSRLYLGVHWLFDGLSATRPKVGGVPLGKGVADVAVAWAGV